MFYSRPGFPHMNPDILAFCNDLNQWVTVESAFQNHMGNFKKLFITAPSGSSGRRFVTYIFRNNLPSSPVPSVEAVGNF